MLSFNKKQNTFFLFTHDEARAKRAGLTLSTKVTGPNGEKCFFTAGYDHKPDKNPYAALEFFGEADEDARRELGSLKEAYDRSWADNSPKVFPAPPGYEYAGFQNAGISAGLEKGSLLIGDEPGLGKTGQAIGICEARKEKRNLVIVPATIRKQWAKAVTTWTDGRRSAYPILKSSDGTNPHCEYNITSYDLTRNEGLHGALMSQTWDNLIVDEAHYAKNTGAGRTQAIFGGGAHGSKYFEEFIRNKCGNVIALTGTYLPNRPREAYILAKAINWEAIDWMTFNEFCYRFNPSGYADNGMLIEEREGRLEELQARLRCNFMIRRLKADVAKYLPPKTYEMSYIETDGGISEVLKKERMLNFRPEDLRNQFTPLFGMISTIRREMGEAKIPRIVEHLRYLMDDLEIPKVVVFCHHRSVMDALEHYLGQYGVVQVRGGMSSNQKEHSVESFVRESTKRIFIGQLDSAGFGVDGLQSVANYVVFAEPSWVPGTNEQAVDRCHRMGQKNNVIAQFLIVEGSIDERMLTTVFDKTHVIHNSLDKRL